MDVASPCEKQTHSIATKLKASAACDLDICVVRDIRKTGWMSQNQAFLDHQITSNYLPTTRLRLRVGPGSGQFTNWDCSPASPLKDTS